MYDSNLSEGLVFRLLEGGSVYYYVTNLPDDVLTRYYNETSSYAELKEKIEFDGYKVNEYTPVYYLNYDYK